MVLTRAVCRPCPPRGEGALFQCLSHPALVSLIDLDATAAGLGGELASAAREFRHLYNVPSELDARLPPLALLPEPAGGAAGSLERFSPERLRQLQPAQKGFDLAVHLRLILPGVDHDEHRNTARCDLEVSGSGRTTEGGSPLLSHRCRGATMETDAARCRLLLLLSFAFCLLLLLLLLLPRRSSSSDGACASWSLSSSLSSGRRP